MGYAQARPQDEDSDYLHTQFIAELFKSLFINTHSFELCLTHIPGLFLVLVGSFPNLRCPTWATRRAQVAIWGMRCVLCTSVHCSLHQTLRPTLVLGASPAPMAASAYSRLRVWHHNTKSAGASATAFWVRLCSCVLALSNNHPCFSALLPPSPSPPSLTYLSLPLSLSLPAAPNGTSWSRFKGLSLPPSLPLPLPLPLSPSLSLSPHDSSGLKLASWRGRRRLPGATAALWATALVSRAAVPSPSLARVPSLACRARRGGPAAAPKSP